MIIIIKNIDLAVAVYCEDGKDHYVNGFFRLRFN